jgi:hypothetical protein
MSARNSLTIKVAKFISIAVGLAVCGAVVAVAGAYIGGKGFSDDVYSALGLAFIGIILGYLLGNIIGIVLVKKILHQHGSIFLGILGCVAGVAITVITTIIWDPGISLFFPIAIISVPVLCLAGFYLKK